MEGDATGASCAQVMNGLTGRLVDRTNGGAPLTFLPIAALKQNGLLQTLMAGGDTPTPTEEDEELEKARQEWEALENAHPALTEDASPTPVISFNEALQFFQTSDLGGLLKNIQPTVRRTGLAAVTRFLFGPPRLQRELLEERDLVFAIAQCQVDNSQAVHMRVLQTVYKRLVGSKLDCPRYGGHWESIGFQGMDPATDLRGTGFLGLMHPLYFVMDPETLPLARDIYKLSQHPTQNFPFSVMSINMTRIALQVLREEALSKECNRRQQVVGVLNDFYVATYLHLYQLWRNQQKTINDSGFVLKGEAELSSHWSVVTRLLTDTDSLPLQSGAVCQEESQADAAPPGGLPEGEAGRQDPSWDLAGPSGPAPLPHTGRARGRSPDGTGRQSEGDALHRSV
ncbi:ELMO domain-containing protein 3 isoform X2 [Antennarius striatus]|uniref:ELMO domain-containing protein 3 isoform X2 n=1 Tax=Antennarius striatus TaxID=241820 RepID=UPI0035B01D4B